MQTPIEQAKSQFKKALIKGQVLKFNQLDLNCDNDELEIYTRLLMKWYDSIINLTFLPNDLFLYEEIYIHGPTKIRLKSQGKFTELDCDLTFEDLQLVAEIMAIKNHKNWNYKEPFTSFYTMIHKVKTRISLIHHSTIPTNHSKIFIRILNDHPLDIKKYNGPFELYKEIIDLKKNVLIAGATGSGKTTFANSILSLISEAEHLIIIEDTNELIPPNQYVTKLLVDEKNENKSMASYLNYSMRMSPDRIILGEIRGKEAEASLISMNTGHNGFISTIHSNSAKEAIDRLCLLFKIYSNKDLSYDVVLKLISSNINYVIFLEDKKVTEIIEIYGSQNENIFFESIYAINE